MEKCHDHSLWCENENISKYKNNYAYETFMATNFIPSTSKKEQLKEYVAMVSMFWKIITKRKTTFKWVEQHVAEDKWDKLCSDYFCTIEKVGNIRTKKSSTMIKRVERSRNVKSGRE